MDYRGELAAMKKLAERLRSADPMVTLDIFENYVSHDIACLLLDKVFAVSEDNDEEHDEPQHPESLLDLCVALVGSDKRVVDTLYAIYGPDANFPFPSWVEPRVQELSEVDDLESNLKLALLLSNNASISFNFSTSYKNEETEVSKVLGPLLWNKLSRFCTNLQVFRVTYSRNEDEDESDVCNLEFYRTENILQALQHLSNLRVLEAPQIVFLDADFEILGASLPQLKKFEFKYDGRVSKIGVQALGQLRNLEELLFDLLNEELEFLEGSVKIIDAFISRCLGALPWLKVLCSTVDEENSVVEHMLPAVECGHELSLEHLQIRGCIEMFQENEGGEEKTFPFLRHVKFLKIFELDNSEEMIKKLMDLELKSLENFQITEHCEFHPTSLILNKVGQNLTHIDLADCKGPWNILRVIEAVPVAKLLSISGEKGYYYLEDHTSLQHISPNLWNLHVDLVNRDNCQLPRGVLARLLALPYLKHLTLYQLTIPSEECMQVALKIKSRVLKLENLSSFYYHSRGEDSTLLVAILCLFCPHLGSLEIRGASGPFKRFLFVLSALLYPKIEINRMFLF